MKIRNRDLFSNLNSDEAWFMEPGQEPWRALLNLARLLDRFRCPGRRKLPKWPLLKALDPKYLDRHKGSVDIVGTARVFGGKRLKSDGSVLIVGPVFFGENVTLRANVVVTGPCYVGDGVKVGHNCRIKDSIIRANAEVVYGTHLADCVVGAGVRLDKSVQIADRPVPDWFAKRYPTLDACGAAIGDGSVLEAGVLLGSGVVLIPGSHMELGVRRRASDIYEGRMKA